jgi:aromatic ring-opening dioxygenase catalytic subunit (LigB family)
MTAQKTLPTFFVSHGGGPWPWVEQMRPMFVALEQWLAALPGTLPMQPKAALVVTAHWEEPEFTVGTGASPPMLYDYSGFPAHTYQIKYPAPGSPAVAARVQQLLTAAGIPVRTDSVRGFDHGTFVPMAIIYPQANIPVVQLSLKRGLDASEHLRVGAALEPLRHEGVLIIGSGTSYHNMRGFGGGGDPASRMFEQWLTAAVTSPDVGLRNRQLVGWEAAPGARASHPREEHLIPLMVAAGAAGNDLAQRDLLEEVIGLASASYRFG